MSSITALVRPEILALKPYSSARLEYSASNQVFLNANENPYQPYGQQHARINRYPEPQPKDLAQTLSNLYGVESNQILLTRGMDEGIDLLIRTCCVPYQDSITIITPTFGYYEVSASIQGINTIKINSLDEICLPTKIVFICTPNNPTGEVISLETISTLCKKVTAKAIVAVDEAYLEYSDYDSATTLLSQYDNLVVMKTLSKAYGMAGLRIGSLMANSNLIAIIKKVIPPYPIPSPCVEKALGCLSPIGLYHMRVNIEKIIQERERVFAALHKSSDILKVYPSQTNFLLFIAQNADTLYENLIQKGIVIRKRTQDIPGALRVTIGTEQENNLFLSALGLLNLPISSIRCACQSRQTKETEIRCEVVIDQIGSSMITTGIPFFDHMLEQLAKHSGISLSIQAIGDTQVDLHHTVEDVAITLGLALKSALGDKCGIRRYGFVLPMDEAQAQVSLDLSGRGYCQFEADFKTLFVGSFPTEMIKHFFESLSDQLGASLHIRVTGENSHHMIESIFKCFAKSLKQAVLIESDQLPSTKGVL